MSDEDLADFLEDSELLEELEELEELGNEELDLDELVEVRGRLERHLAWVKEQLQQRLKEAHGQ